MLPFNDEIEDIYEAVDAGEDDELVVAPTKTWIINWEGYGADSDGLPIPQITSRFFEEEDALSQSIRTLLTTPRYTWEIFDDKIGFDINSLVDKPYEYLEVVLPQMVKDCLTYDDRVLDIQNVEIVRADSESVALKIEVLDVYNDNVHIWTVPLDSNMNEQLVRGGVIL